MKKIIIVVLNLIIFFNLVTACDCVLSEFEVEVTNSDHIYIAKVISIDTGEINQYTLVPIKIWKGNLKIGQLLSIKQGRFSCDSYLEKDQIYVLYSTTSRRISICSHSAKLEFSENLDKLDKIFPDFRIDQRKVDTVIYELQYTVKTNNNKLINIEGKNVLYFDCKNISSNKPNHKYEGNYQLYLISKDKKLNDRKIDYIFYVEYYQMPRILDRIEIENINNEIRARPIDNTR